jgi:hypothetical protein
VDLGLRRFGYFQQGGRAGGIAHAGDDDVGRVGRVELDELETDPTGGSGDCTAGGTVSDLYERIECDTDAY